MLPDTKQSLPASGVTLTVLPPGQALGQTNGASRDWRQMSAFIYAWTAADQVSNS
jgi:hypothetical protein